MNPASRTFRLTILGLASFMLFGSYFAYDSVAAIAPSLIEALHADRAAIGTMYSAYSFAAIAAVLLGGVLIDKIGTRRASLLFSAVLTVGACLVAFAPSIGWIYVGRLLFGMGSEPLVVAQSAILARIADERRSWDGDPDAARILDLFLVAAQVPVIGGTP